MNGILILLIAIIALSAGYIFYGRWLAKKWGVSNNLKTPAVEINDGIDYVPTKKQVVFGLLPVMLLCFICGLFLGAVQDFSSMFASVRNKGRSLGFIF